MGSRYAIYRILGNELPPRDLPGARLAALDLILAAEPRLDSAAKWWLINRVHAPDLSAAYAARLVAAGQHFVVLPPPGREVLDLPRHLMAREAIGINHARNTAIRLGAAQADVTVVLDGDCYFTRAQWRAFDEAASASPARDYYSVPSHRTDHGGSRIAGAGEPMVAFRRGAALRFDEGRTFGDNDKRELLYRLGHARTPGLELTPGCATAVAGGVMHAATGDLDAERDVATRMARRAESIESLLASLASRHTVAARPPTAAPLTSDAWESIPGMFDFQVPYRKAVLEAPDVGHFVEVGSWLGRSTAFLAQAIKDSGKAIRLDAVDRWFIDPEGSPEQAATLARMGGVDRLHEAFLANMRAVGVDDVVHPVKALSVDAARLYGPGTLDFVFIDASHDRDSVVADLVAWYPKVRRGGLIAGHDYTDAFPGVVSAVDEFFAGQALEVRPYASTWRHRKP